MLFVDLIAYLLTISWRNVELWWVLRTPSEFIVQKRKGFAVTNPGCTFDTANNRYFPYAIINEDGTPRA